MGGARQAGVIVEAPRDHGDADRGPFEARHHALVAAEHVDVAPIADVPPSGLAAVADGLGGLAHQPLTRRAGMAPPALGLVRRPRLLEPVPHRVEHAAEAVGQSTQGLAGIDQP